MQFNISPLHTTVAGSGVQVPSTVIPSDVQFALILPAGTYPAWGTHEEYLCTNQCALIQLNKAIPRTNGHPTVD